MILLLSWKMFTEDCQVQVCSPFPVRLCQFICLLQCYHDIFLYHTLFKGTQTERKQHQQKHTCFIFPTSTDGYPMDSKGRTKSRPSRSNKNCIFQMSNFQHSRFFVFVHFVHSLNKVDMPPCAVCLRMLKVVLKLTF